MIFELTISIYFIINWIVYRIINWICMWELYWVFLIIWFRRLTFEIVIIYNVYLIWMNIFTIWLIILISFFMYIESFFRDVLRALREFLLKLNFSFYYMFFREESLVFIEESLDSTLGTVFRATGTERSQASHCRSFFSNKWFKVANVVRLSESTILFNLLNHICK